jgi:predicted membrane channel-forming protein YqfA (hemolysin III family)
MQWPGDTKEVNVLSVLWFTISVYLFGISWSLYCLSSDIRLLFTSLVSLGHCIVCPLIYDFCLPLWYLLVIILSVLWYTISVYLFGISMTKRCQRGKQKLYIRGQTIQWPRDTKEVKRSRISEDRKYNDQGISWSLYCLSSDLRVLFTSLVSLGHCIVCPLIYDFCLPLWYLLVIVLSVLWYKRGKQKS